MSDIRLKISNDSPAIRLSVSVREPVSIKIDDNAGTLFPAYDGATVVTPSTSEQILPTKKHMLMDDITVREIPYAQTSNPAGGYTVSIAS